MSLTNSKKKDNSMQQTIHFSKDFDFKAVHDYIKRIPQVKQLHDHSVKMTVFKEFTTDLVIPVRSNSIDDGLDILSQQYQNTKLTTPKIVNIEETEDKLIVTYKPFYKSNYNVSLKITK
jgi:hypothetical protein